jgi:hypothetical protein
VVQEKYGGEKACYKRHVDDDYYDYDKETCMVIDVAVAGDRNVIKKEAEKILKYEQLTL